MSSPEIIDLEENDNMFYSEPNWWEDQVFEPIPSPKSVNEDSSDTIPCCDVEQYEEHLNSQQPTTALSQEATNIKRQERELLKEQRKKAKLDKAALVAKQKNIKPEEVIKTLKLVIDSDLLSNEYGTKILLELQQAEIKFNVDRLPISSTVKFFKESQELDFLVIFMPWLELVKLVSVGELYNSVCNKTSSKKSTLIVLGFDKYLKFRKNKMDRDFRAKLGTESKHTKKERDLNSAPVVTLEDVEMDLVKLQMLENINHRFVETPEEVATFLVQFSKSVSQIEFKQQKYEKDAASMQWWAHEDNKSCVKVDKLGHGLLSFWQQQIMQFPLSGLEMAQAIVEKYDTPKALLKAYKECLKDPLLLLQDIPVRRNAGVLSSTRKIGPELSKKIYTFFSSTNPSAEI